MKGFRPLGNRFESDANRLVTDETGKLKFVANYNRPERSPLKLSVGATARIRLIGDPVIMRSHAFNGLEHINRGYAAPCLRTVGRPCPICDVLDAYKTPGQKMELEVWKLHTNISAREEYAFNVIRPKKAKEEDYMVEALIASNALYAKIVKVSQLWGEAKYNDKTAAAAWHPEKGLDLLLKKESAQLISVAPADGERQEDTDTETYTYPTKKSYPALEEWLDIPGWFAQKEGNFEQEKEVLNLFYYQVAESDYLSIANQVQQLFANLESFESFDDKKPAKTSASKSKPSAEEDEDFQEHSKAAADKYGAKAKKIASTDDDEDEIPF